MRLAVPQAAPPTAETAAEEPKPESIEEAKPAEGDAKSTPEPKAASTDQSAALGLSPEDYFNDPDRVSRHSGCFLGGMGYFQEAYHC
jgi:hypothetical protein